MKRPRYKYIERTVDDLLDTNRIRRPPVPIERLISNARVKMRYGDLGDVSGLLARRPDDVIIGVNINHPPGRQRFTLAHEFGHFILHEGILSHADRDFKVKYRNRDSSEATDFEEIEANFFAASLLMPKRFLDEGQAVDCIDDDQRIQQLAMTYQVSQHAMSLRLSNLYREYRPF